MPVGRIEGLSTNAAVFQVVTPLRSRVDTPVSEELAAQEARAQDSARLEDSPREIPQTDLSAGVSEIDQDAVVIDISDAATRAAEQREEQEAVEDLNDVDLDRASDFFAAEGVPGALFSDDESEEGAEEEERVTIDNNANISRFGAEAARTEPVNRNGAQPAELIPANQLEVQPATEEEAGQEQGQNRVVSGEESREERDREQKEEQAENKEIQELKKRDSEVRRHEQAHKAVLGSFAAGGISYDYTRGPNGVQYAIGGSVPVDVSEEGSPEETIRKAQTIRRAALAPAEPSGADRRVAAQASQLEASARQELKQLEREERQEAQESQKSNSQSSGILQGIEIYQRNSAGQAAQDITGSLFASVL